jgi:hypothetical chaperone protein
MERQSLEPKKLQALRSLIESDGGYRLYEAVESAKAALSNRDSVEFVFAEGLVEIRQEIARTAFEAWIRPELDAIERTLERLLRIANVAPASVDSVFLTGGTSFVPAVRRLFVDRFGEDRVRDGRGDAFTSVATGLARSHDCRTVAPAGP